MTELPLLGGTTIWPQLTQHSHRCLLQVVMKTLRGGGVKQVRVHSQDVRFCRANAEPTEQYSGTPWQVCVHSLKEEVNVAAAAPIVVSHPVLLLVWGLGRFGMCRTSNPLNIDI